MKLFRSKKVKKHSLNTDAFLCQEQIYILEDGYSNAFVNTSEYNDNYFIPTICRIISRIIELPQKLSIHIYTAYRHRVKNGFHGMFEVLVFPLKLCSLFTFVQFYYISISYYTQFMPTGGTHEAYLTDYSMKIHRQI